MADYTARANLNTNIQKSLQALSIILAAGELSPVGGSPLGAALSTSKTWLRRPTKGVRVARNYQKAVGWLGWKRYFRKSQSSSNVARGYHALPHRREAVLLSGKPAGTKAGYTRVIPQSRCGLRATTGMWAGRGPDRRFSYISLVMCTSYDF